MNDRRLLLSLLALPACGPSVADVDDPREPDGGDPEMVQSSCEAAYSAMYACYEELGYGSSDGDYASSGSYDPGDYVDELCGSTAEYAEQYGPQCAGAFEEVFACLASLDCGTIAAWQEGDAYAPEPCQAVFLDASDRCPENFRRCASQGVSFGAGCEVTASSCVEGNTYAVRCSEPGATQSCECDREQTVTVAGDLACGSPELLDELTSACGFPPGVF